MISLSNCYFLLKEIGFTKLNKDLWDLISQEANSEKVKKILEGYFLQYKFNFENINKNPEAYAQTLRYQLRHFLTTLYILLWELNIQYHGKNLKREVDSFLSKKCRHKASFAEYRLPLLSFADEIDNTYSRIGDN